MAEAKTVSFGRAWKYCFTKKSYTIPLIIVSIISLGIMIYTYVGYTNTKFDGKPPFYATVVGIFAIGFALLKAPAEYAANTTVENADKGIWI